MSQRHVPDVLRAAGHTVYIQRDWFASGTQDVDWLPKVGAEKWTLITKDQGIRKRPIEMAALLHARVRAFVLTAGELSGAAQGEVFQKALPAIARLIARKRPPFVANVTASGQVEVMDLKKYLRR